MFNQTKKKLVDDNILDKVLNKVKKIIDIAKFDDTTFLIDTDNTLPDDIPLTNVVILIAFVIKDDVKCYVHLFLEEGLVA